MGTMQNCDQTISMTDYNKGERGKSSVSDEDEPSFTEDGVDGHNDGSKGKKGSPWQRVKWTDKMVRLLITAVSYIGEDAVGDCGGGMRRKFAVLQKKGKWKSVSKVMAERGYHVSPQQCEDKFNDLNKRGTYGMLGGSAKRSRQGQIHEDACFQHSLNSQDCNKSPFSYPPITQADINQVPPESSRAAWLQKQWVESRSVQLEEQKLQIQVEMLELEKQRFKWQRFSKKRDRELEKMRMENERMKLENERMALELKRKELAAD
ncbi:putative transcription factor [Corchorus capsularis]|uniref:Putative transcription factor n=1 Tax=Corchorus capsularis TaxID=210143 RepID=A0A1R3GB22_COCAP|nr:putative transcription factor [Corchorus capsularis]